MKIIRYERTKFVREPTINIESENSAQNNSIHQSQKLIYRLIGEVKHRKLNAWEQLNKLEKLG